VKLCLTFVRSACSAAWTSSAARLSERCASSSNSLRFCHTVALASVCGSLSVPGGNIEAVFRLRSRTTLLRLAISSVLVSRLLINLARAFISSASRFIAFMRAPTMRPHSEGQDDALAGEVPVSVPGSRLRRTQRFQFGHLCIGLGKSAFAGGFSRRYLHRSGAVNKVIASRRQLAPRIARLIGNLPTPDVSIVRVLLVPF
jgi:hypothetical protein